METIQATEIRKGTLVIYEGSPYRVLSFEHRTPGNKRGFIQAKLRHLIDGTQRDIKLGSSEYVERARIDAREMDYLYADGSSYVFMDIATYEQHSLPNDLLGDSAVWLSENMRIGIETLDGSPIGIQLPKTIEITVRETESVVKGQTAARSTKPAILENGVRIQVPTFLNSGDRIRVDPEEGRYIDRVKS
jgi:elongation factor P